MIETVGQGRTWVLSGPSGSYALHLTDRDELLHLHWGPRITGADAEELAVGALPPYWPFESPLDGHEEYPVEGGPRFVRPALSVRTPEARGTEWRFTGASVSGPGGPGRPGGPGDGEELRLGFHDPVHGLGLVLHYRLREGFDVVERHVTLTHEGDGPALELLRADSAAWTLPGRDSWRLSKLHGRWAAESRLERTPLAHGEQIIGSRRGHTGHQHLPWVALDAEGATEESGEVYGCALGWSGSWRIAVQRLPDGQVQITGGAGHDGSGLLRLAPGESWTSPVFAGLWSPDGFGGASRTWHAWQLAHVVPGAAGERPVLYNSWEATGFDISADQQLALARRAAGLGVELFVVDDAWFGARTSDRAGLGDWTPNPERFPGGLAPLADAVHALGMGFGIWVEPEMVNQDSDLYRAHPDWVQHHPGRTRTELRHQLVLNAARPDVREHLWRQLDRLLGSARIDYVKWDFNRCFTDPGWPGDPYPQRLWVEHVEGLYGLLDRLRAAYPAVAFESCSGGGGRIDLGVLSRTDQVWTSDNTDPLDRLAIQHGFTQIHPARVMAAWVTDSPNTQLNGRRSSLRFRFVSAMAGVLGIGGQLTGWSEAELAEARDWVALYKRIRPLVQHGELYRLRPPGGGLSAVQYLRGGESVVLAWLQAQHYGERPPRLRLRGLDPAAVYVRPETGETHRGAVLLHHGLHTGLSGDLDAEVIRLQRQPSP
ncbi:alpha-galactosidase [Streptomyces clavuligerus]|uniref:Alpha-galactosidase n=1 Tax=Streptomyces clavuligerus TaxID=1901 RepID=E2PZ54_STRCL|nr:alpha-galactosidase [Streptomyces clavuligerus]ANW17217.1 alpha-galactosidase [Streptomyces clavuligerus]AXU11757.1 alpha-galactosidase [Streptomyces clavuligerus]EFG10315.1 alpha-galactosidase [Streptomyces clavuligerus]MBY6301595.1 alpha-galactosidase [Streptomyces clavuligerus]QCS04538.1 alpha-galactosidase [Streptomyces clavuligerus]